MWRLTSRPGSERVLAGAEGRSRWKCEVGRPGHRRIAQGDGGGSRVLQGAESSRYGCTPRSSSSDPPRPRNPSTRLRPRSRRGRSRERARRSLRARRSPGRCRRSRGPVRRDPGNCIDPDGAEWAVFAEPRRELVDLACGITPTESWIWALRGQPVAAHRSSSIGRRHR